ncbi:MAG: Inner membrane ABC transporter permease protein YjfF [Phycisphaerales bacterium]|nr:Inner membrane ABC transporter permease protein YjfF [Phycisphaerales bacterium]
MTGVSARVIPLLATLAVLVGAFAAGALLFDNFASWAVVRNLFIDNAALGVAAIGASLVILSGGIDLSIGSVMAFTGIFVAWLIEKQGVHPLAAMAMATTVGLAFGIGQGVIIQRFAIPAFLVTLAGMFLARGAAFWIYPQSLGIRHEFVASTMNDAMTFRLPVGPRGVAIPLTVDIFLVVAAAAVYFLRCTRAGRCVYAIGDDAEAARLMGIPVARTRIMTYGLCGMCSALAGIVFALYQQSGNPASCTGWELDAIAAVVIGGTRLRGGVGSVQGTVLGVLILGLIQTLITFGDVNSWLTRIAVGGLMLGFVALQRLIESIADRGRAPGRA